MITNPVSKNFPFKQTFKHKAYKLQKYTIVTMKTVTVRIKESEFEDLKLIEQQEHIDRAEAVRKLLSFALKNWKIKTALDLIKQRKMTIRKAAELVGITYIEMLDLISKADIDIGYELNN